ncbi:hypothetical protein KIPB_000769 [Kipferlia bialata]|uniref:Uncharacterized protein n=1 Tax=Kipferlia bialata TaxID=797122 RepID=A0A9K3GEY7_9EUKA|nr:hypothetical protein KIPB_000769 [Kipferlia bialata]|eukprot:g769.t1
MSSIDDFSIPEGAKVFALNLPPNFDVSALDGVRIKLPEMVQQSHRIKLNKGFTGDYSVALSSDAVSHVLVNTNGEVLETVPTKGTLTVIPTMPSVEPKAEHVNATIERTIPWVTSTQCLVPFENIPEEGDVDMA